MVARLLWEQEVPGSNPGAPTSRKILQNRTRGSPPTKLTKAYTDAGYLLEVRDGLQRMLVEVPLTEDERAAAESDQQAVEKLIDGLQDVATPAGPSPRQITHDSYSLLGPEASEGTSRRWTPAHLDRPIPAVRARLLREPLEQTPSISPGTGLSKRCHRHHGADSACQLHARTSWLILLPSGRRVSSRSPVVAGSQRGCRRPVTQDRVTHSLPSGDRVCRLRLAVSGMAPGRETGSIDVSTFGAAGEAAARTLSKGWIVAVDGRLEYALGRPTTGRPVTATR